MWLCLNVLLNATTVSGDFARLGIHIAPWEPWVWEGSSHLVLGLLIPLVWLLYEWPIHRVRLLRPLFGLRICSRPGARAPVVSNGWFLT